MGIISAPRGVQWTYRDEIPSRYQPRTTFVPQPDLAPSLGLDALTASIARPDRITRPDPHVAAIAAETLRRHDAAVRHGLYEGHTSPSYAPQSQWHSARRVDPSFGYSRPVPNPTYVPRKRN